MSFNNIEFSNSDLELFIFYPKFIVLKYRSQWSYILLINYYCPKMLLFTNHRFDQKPRTLS